MPRYVYNDNKGKEYDLILSVAKKEELEIDDAGTVVLESTKLSVTFPVTCCMTCQFVIDTIIQIAHPRNEWVGLQNHQRYVQQDKTTGPCWHRINQCFPFKCWGETGGQP